MSKKTSTKERTNVASAAKTKTPLGDALDAAMTEEELNGTPGADGDCCGTCNDNDNETGTEIALVVPDAAVVDAPEGFKRKTDTAFDKLLATVASTGQKYREYAHEAAMQSLIDAGVSGDLTRLTKLYKILVVKNETKQLVAWAKAYGPIRLATTEKAGEQFKKNKDGNEYNFVGADASPFWSIELYTPQEILDKLFGTDDFRKRIENMVSDIEKMEEGRAEKKRINPDDMTDVVAIKDMLKDVCTRIPTRKAA